MPYRPLSFIMLLVLALSLIGCDPHHQQPQQQFEIEAMPPLPVEVEAPFFGVHNGAAVIAQGGEAWVLPAENLLSSRQLMMERVGTDPTTLWQRHAALRLPRSHGASASSPQGIVCAGGIQDGQPSAAVTLLYWDSQNRTLGNRDLPDLPSALTDGHAATDGSTAYVSNGQDAWSLNLKDSQATWKPLNPMPRLTAPVMAMLQDKLYLFGQTEDGPKAYRYQDPPPTQEQTARLPAPAEPQATEIDPEAPNDPESEAEKDHRVWHELASPPRWPPTPQAQPYHLGYIFVFSGTGHDSLDELESLVYNAITDRWTAFTRAEAEVESAESKADHALVFSNGRVVRVKPVQLQTNYGWIDNTVVAVYLLGMIGMGWYFAKRENSTKDFFRGGQRIPWWAAGMSLFATGASAISLAAMPGMAYGTDWTYFQVSIWSVVFLPIGIFIMAPLVRRLNIATANEYLERRFGITSRLFGSLIYMFLQIAGRIASVMLISAIALEAITDLDLWTCILIMGLITTIYTYLGGLEAVIWTDTVQGFVMITSVVGCLFLAVWWLPMGPGEMWQTISEYDKNEMVDWSFVFTGPTVWVLMLNVLFTVLQAIGDQNFVQRVQSTPDLRQTKLAVATQLAVAVPINILLFALGTVLWLFYRSHPESISPTIVNNDGVFPFFAAQQLPIGVSGIVVAALLAATMSTVSSSICAVSDLGTNDFYRRFKSDATDHQCLWLGRVLTAFVGGFGTLAAIVLAQAEGVKSVWDLFIAVSGLISAGVLGLFLLGLLTRRAHELGALIGALAGMGVVIYVKQQTELSHFLYIAIGPVVAIGVGYTASLLLPGTPRQTRGLTLWSLRHASAAPALPKDRADLDSA